MRILVASDIHGSFKVARQVMDKFQEEKADKLLLLGDILYHGPRNDLPEDYAPKKVIELLNEHKNEILAVRGNCDTEVDQMVLNFPILADYMYLVVGEKVFYATHGHHYNPDNLPVCLNDGDTLLYGHTHVAVDGKIGNIRYMNPGSPSIPKNGTAPSYIIIDNDGSAVLKEF